MFVELLGTQLHNIDGDYTITICEALGAIGSLRSETLLPLIETILTLLIDLAAIPNPSLLQTRPKQCCAL
nr:unnamed protein product [Callosobruchus chinensis]